MALISVKINYLNINSFRNKISDLRIALKTIKLDDFVVCETKTYGYV